MEQMVIDYGTKKIYMSRDVIFDEQIKSEVNNIPEQSKFILHDDNSEIDENIKSESPVLNSDEIVHENQDDPSHI